MHRFVKNLTVITLTARFSAVKISLALNKKSAQKQKELLTTASRKPLFHKRNTKTLSNKYHQTSLAAHRPGGLF